MSFPQIWQTDPGRSNPSSWLLICLIRLCFLVNDRVQSSWGQFILISSLISSKSLSLAFKSFRISSYSPSSISNWKTNSSSELSASYLMSTSSSLNTKRTEYKRITIRRSALSHCWLTLFLVHLIFAIVADICRLKQRSWLLRDNFFWV